MFERVFVDTPSEDLEEMALLVISGSVGRDDYRRMCRWLIGGICALDGTPDPTLLILEESTGRVGDVKIVLLRQAFKKWRVVVDSFVLNDESNLVLMVNNPLQGSLLSDMPF